MLLERVTLNTYVAYYILYYIWSVTWYIYIKCHVLHMYFMLHITREGNTKYICSILHWILHINLKYICRILRILHVKRDVIYYICISCCIFTREGGRKRRCRSQRSQTSAPAREKHTGVDFTYYMYILRIHVTYTCYIYILHITHTY
jgi:hypothetical protein